MPKSKRTKPKRLTKSVKQTYHVRIGRYYWFEYHCEESHQSADAKLWYHSHQRCKVLSRIEPGGGRDEVERGEAGHCAIYRVRFQDAQEFDACEDELLDSPTDYCRPHPPAPPIKTKREIY